MKHSLTRSEVEDLLKNGKRIISGAVKIIYKKTGDSGAGYAVLIPKKTMKGASDRNRMRRTIREIIRVSAMPPALFVVVYNGGRHSYQALKKTIEHTVKNLP